jgi:predicted O-linked N-acetylglucosamine transferase (SPINDLY family)
VIARWSAALAAVPRSRLLVFRTTLSPSIEARLGDEFVKNGIERGRIDFCREVPAGGHWEVYSAIDIALDTLPWSGHTTACEGLWMGVPMVTLTGNRHAGRMVTSVLAELDMRDLSAATGEEFVTIAGTLAGDLDNLARLRGALRERMRGSGLCDGVSLARAVERAYLLIEEEAKSRGAADR